MTDMIFHLIQLEKDEQFIHKLSKTKIIKIADTNNRFIF